MELKMISKAKKSRSKPSLVTLETTVATRDNLSGKLKR